MSLYLYLFLSFSYRVQLPTSGWPSSLSSDCLSSSSSPFSPSPTSPCTKELKNELFFSSIFFHRPHLGRDNLLHGRQLKLVLGWHVLVYLAPLTIEEMCNMYFADSAQTEYGPTFRVKRVVMTVEVKRCDCDLKTKLIWVSSIRFLDLLAGVQLYISPNSTFTQ